MTRGPVFTLHDRYCDQTHNLTTHSVYSVKLFALDSAQLTYWNSRCSTMKQLMRQWRVVRQSGQLTCLLSPWRPRRRSADIDFVCVLAVVVRAPLLTGDLDSPLLSQTGNAACTLNHPPLPLSIYRLFPASSLDYDMIPVAEHHRWTLSSKLCLVVCW